MKQIFLFISLAVLVAGLYMKFLAHMGFKVKPFLRKHVPT
jgi:hypothetical protein